MADEWWRLADGAARRVRWVLAGSLLPWAAFIVTTVVADERYDGGTVALARVAAAAPWYLMFVAVPSAMPIAVSRHRVTRGAATVVMTATAAVAGALVVASDDAQAGLAVLWVPYVAMPTAVVIGLAQAVAACFRPPQPP
jgi:hypothetical protein